MSAPAPVRLLARTIRATALTARAVLASALAVFLLAGLPYGLIRYIGWPLPHHLASIGQLKKDVTGPVLGDQVYLDVIAIVIWLLWLLITVSFAAETIALIRGVELPPIPGLRPTQALAVILLTTIGITALMARAAAPAQAATSATQVPARAPAASAPLSPGTAHAESTASAASADAPGPSLTHPSETAHTVVAGDNLYDIARADYGNGDDWKVLYTINAGHTQADGQKLTDPSLIQPGWVLATSEPAPSAASAPSGHSTHSDAAPSNAAPAGSPSTAPAHATPAPTAAQTPTHSASGQAGTDSTPAPHPPAHSTGNGSNRPAPPSAASSDWIELAEGGALAAGVLAALTLALARARRRRRWHGTCYWPTPGEHQAEPLTVPVPLRPAVRQVAQQSTDADELDEFGAPTSAQPAAPDQEPAITALEDASSESTPTVGGPAGTREETRADLEDAGPARITVAAADGHTLALQELAPAIALTGPGAMSAARAITAGVLSAAEHRRDGARLLISRQDLVLLLEGRAPDLPCRPAAVADLELFDDGPSAVTQLEAYTAYRTRLLDEHDATALEQILDEDDFPPVVLLAVARPETAERVASTLAAGAGLRVHAILLGEHSGAANWHVDATGHLSGPDAPHGATSFQLSAGALEAALAVLTAASGEDLAEQGPPIAPDPLGELAVPETEPEPSTVTPEAEADPHADAEETAGIECSGLDNAEAQTSEATGEDPDAATSESAGLLSLTSTGTPTPAAGAGHDEPIEAGADPARTDAGPLLLVANPGPDRIAEITESYAAHPVRIKVLGVRAIITPTGSIDARLRGDAWRAAMKLALAGRHGQSLDDFATLWPDQDDAALRGTVKNAIYDLRKTLRARCGDSAGNPNRYIVQANHRYAFNTESVAVDLTAFTALRALAAQARDAGERRAAATAALDLYDADLLAGQEEEWMIAPRTKTRRDALATATLLAQLADRADDPDTAITWWERALEIDDNEEVYRQIIILQLRLRHHADAVATCDLLLARLDADGLAPAPETMAVIARARGRQPRDERTYPAGRRAA